MQYASQKVIHMFKFYRNIYTITFTQVTFTAFLTGRSYPIAVDYNRYLIYKFCFSESSERKSVQFIYFTFITSWPWKVGLCLHVMMHPQIVEGWTASNMEGSCEYIRYAVADSRQGFFFQIGGWVRSYQILTLKKELCFLTVK